MRFQFINFGLIVALILNFIISFLFVIAFIGESVLSLGITIGIFVCSIGILYTPIGDWWYRKVMFHLREPNEIEQKRIMPIYNEVYRRALTLAPNLPKNIKLFIYDDDDINAFAIGLKTIAVHRGLLNNNIYDSEIAAILGHEFAHIANGDTFCTILAVQSNSIVSVFRTCFSFFVIVMGKIIGFFIAGFFDTKQGSVNAFNITDICIRVFGWYIDKIVWIFVALSVMIAQYSRRRHELAADNFSANLGYRQPMIHFFQRYDELDNKNNSWSLSNLLYGTHPSIKIRIENLKNNI